ncbi:MAG: ComEC/Rec2 family competence protein [Parcubacteria group bacterium]|jgi:competence protein ComEC
MDKSKIFFLLLLSFIGGILCESFWSVSLVLAWLILISAIVIIIINHKNKKLVAIGLIGMFFLLGSGRTKIELEKIKNIKNSPKNISTTVQIIKDPEKKEYYQNLVVKVTENDLWKTSGKNKFKLLIRTDLYRDFKYGEKLYLKCQPQIIENLSSDFDYRMYLAKDKIYYSCKKSEINKIEEKNSSGYKIILDFKNKLETNINRIIPQPEASLANGILFGGGGALSKELQEAFSATGMTHIVAVSGYNVTIIAEYLMFIGIFLGLWRAQSFYFSILGIFLFVAMIGFPSSALRAGVMGCLILWAIKNGRLASLNNAILLAGSIMLAINPLLLRWDIGFQLSFLATVGLVQMAPFWEKYFLNKYKLGGMLEIMLMTISAQLFVLPIILYNFHNLSLISIIANILILPIIPATMLFVFLSAIGSFVFYPIALVFGWLGYILLKYEIVVVSFLSKLKFSSLEINDFKEGKVIVWYILLIGFIYFVKIKIKKTNE